MVRIHEIGQAGDDCRSVIGSTLRHKRRQVTSPRIPVHDQVQHSPTLPYHPFPLLLLHRIVLILMSFSFHRLAWGIGRTG